VRLGLNGYMPMWDTGHPSQHSTKSLEKKKGKKLSKRILPR